MIMLIVFCASCSDIQKKSDRDLALTWAVATVIKDMGLFSLMPNPGLLERTPIFVCKDKKFKLARIAKKVGGIALRFFLNLTFAKTVNLKKHFAISGFDVTACVINVAGACVVCRRCRCRTTSSRRSSSTPRQRAPAVRRSCGALAVRDISAIVRMSNV